MYVIAVVDKIMIMDILYVKCHLSSVSLSRHREMGQQGLWYIGGTSRGRKMQGDDIIFPNLDMCLIMLAGWFNKSLLKKKWNPRCNFLIFKPLG